MTRTATIDVKVLDNRLREWGLPRYAKAGDAGLDVRACLDAELELYPLETQLIDLGFSMHIRDSGIVGILVPRSGLAKQGGVLGNLVGVVDSEYQGPVKAMLWNRGEELIRIKPGQRIAQLIFMPVIHAVWNVVEEFRQSSERGQGGFGSTGQ